MSPPLSDSEKLQLDALSSALHTVPSDTITTSPSVVPITASVGQSGLSTGDDGQDLRHPYRWSLGMKCWITSITAIAVLVVSLGDSVFSAAISEAAVDLDSRPGVMHVAIAAYVLGFGCGSLVWAPWSEAGPGRRTPFLIGFGGFVCIDILLARARNTYTVVSLRFLDGAFGSSALATVTGICVDIWPYPARNIAIIGYPCALLLGTTIGPVIGVLVTQNLSLGWRWTFWLLASLGGSLLVLILFGIPETNAATLLHREAGRHRRETPRGSIPTRADEELPSMKISVFRYTLKPFHMISREPILVVLTIYMSLMYGILYLILFVFQVSIGSSRNVDALRSSLPFLAISGGIIMACAGILWHSLHTRSTRAKVMTSPETRLAPMVGGSVLLTIVLVGWAATTLSTPHVCTQTIGCFLLGAGFALILVPAFTFLVDVYTIHANSALAINTVIRSGVASTFPMLAMDIHKSLGLERASLILAGIALLMIPIPFLFYRYGAMMRQRSLYATIP